MLGECWESAGHAGVRRNPWDQFESEGVLGSLWESVGNPYAKVKQLARSTWKEYGSIENTPSSHAPAARSP